MKKLLVLIAMFAMTSLAAFADFNPQVTQDASFTGTVIKPLTWQVTSPSVNLPTGIAGQNRTSGFTDANSLWKFDLTGEAGKSVILTNNFAFTSGTAEAHVTLDKEWLLNGLQTIPTGGTTPGILKQTFRVKGINATTDAHGTYTWTISVNAIYSGI